MFIQFSSYFTGEMLPHLVIVFYMIYLSRAVDEVFQDNFISDDDTENMSEGAKHEPEAESAKTQMHVKELSNLDTQVRAKVGAVAGMIETLENVRMNADDMNEKITEQQLKLEKLNEEICPKEKFDNFLDRKIQDLENTGKQQEESLYVKAEENIVKKGELSQMIEQKKNLLRGNVKLKNRINNMMSEKGDEHHHQQKIKSLQEESGR